MSLNDTRASQQLDISAKIIKMNVDICFEILNSEFDEAIELSQFLSCMKMADVTPVYKKR